MRYQVKQSAEEYIQMFKDIFEPIQNIERDFYRIFARLVESLAACMQYVNRNDDYKLASSLPNVFSWYCSLVYKCQMFIATPFDDIVWRKYPDVCPYCHKNPCTCAGKRNLLNMQELLEFEESNIKKKPKTLDEWQRMFSRLYPRDPQGFSLASNLNHLYEELGEISEAFRFRYNSIDNVQNELADAFSWILGTANYLNVKAQIDSLYDYQHYSLAEEVFKRFPGHCSKCSNNPCTCNLFIPKISEFNEVFGWKDISLQITQAVEDLKLKIDEKTDSLLHTEDAKTFIREVFNQCNENTATKEDITDAVYTILKNTKYKKWYESITLGGIAENSLVSIIVLIIQMLIGK